ncbi:MAG TPA: sigma-70 family RNA polymerase sigma factor [Dehalococcoidia bacterium]|nr:sigma-70 family RNA polymerase sigma factor [Dehalococcoidia bacterium]
MEERTDIELIELARQGDKDAFGLLLQRYQMIARRFAMRLVANEDFAQQLAQEAMLQAYLSLDHLRDAARFKGWLCGIVLNIYRSRLRARRVTFFSLEAMTGGLQFDAVPLSGITVTPERITEERELHQTILGVINTLEPKDRDATLLFYYEELSLQEIAVLSGVSVGAVKVRLHRARQRLKTNLLSQYPEIIPRGQRRKTMIKVTIADVVKREQTDDQGRSHTLHIIVLQDEAGKRALPIWVGSFEGSSIAMGLGDFSTQRPMTYSFFVSLLQAINAQVEQVRVEMLKGNTFYAVVKIRCGRTVREVDARPSDALGLAVLTGSPVFVAEDVLQVAGVDIPSAAKATPARSGVESILREIGEIQRQEQEQLSHARTQEEITRAKEELIAAIFSS